MERKIFAVKDTKAAAFDNPFLLNSHGEAERGLRLAATDGKSMISLSPEDFHLYYLGTYDTETGKIKVLDAPEHMTSADQLIPRQ